MAIILCAVCGCDADHLDRAIVVISDETDGEVWMGDLPEKKKDALYEHVKRKPSVSTTWIIGTLEELLSQERDNEGSMLDGHGRTLQEAIARLREQKELPPAADSLTSSRPTKQAPHLTVRKNCVADRAVDGAA